MVNVLRSFPLKLEYPDKMIIRVGNAKEFCRILTSHGSNRQGVIRDFIKKFMWSSFQTLPNVFSYLVKMGSSFLYINYQNRRSWSIGFVFYLEHTTLNLWGSQSNYLRCLIEVKAKHGCCLALYLLFYPCTAIFYLKWHSLIIQALRNATTKAVLYSFYPMVVLNDVIWNIDLYLHFQYHFFRFDHLPMAKLAWRLYFSLTLS